MKRFNPPACHSFALVSTLLIVVVLALGALAFFQTARLDRIVTRNTENTLRAQMAAESGLAAALGWLKLALRFPGGGGAGVGGLVPPYVVFLTNHDPGNLGLGPVLAVARRDAGLQTEVFPMVSGPLESFYSNLTSSNNLQNFLALRANTNATSTVNLNLGGWIQHPQTTNWSTNADGSLRRIDGPAWSNHWYRVPWVYLTNVVPIAGGGAVTNVGSRFAFLVVDEQARLNPLVHGGGFTATPRTNSGASADEILINSSAAPIVTNSNTLSLIRSQSGTLSTPDTLGLFIGTNAYRQIRHLVSVRSSPEEDRIPAGYFSNPTTFVPYVDAGKARYNLNNLASQNVFGATPTLRGENIGAIIHNNLASFYSRDLSLTNPTRFRSYANRLGASIVDYMDEDFEPTTVNGGELAGKDMTPYAVMIGEKNTWRNEIVLATNQTRVVLASQFFIQVWNPHAQPISGKFELEVVNRQILEFPGGSAASPKFDDYDQTNLVTFTLRPNEMRAIDFPEVTQNFTVTNRPSTNSSTYPRWPTTSSSSALTTGHPQFRLKWDADGGADAFVTVDMNRQAPPMESPARSGLVRQGPGGRFGPVSVIRWSFNYVPANSPNTVGDPRGNFSTESDWADGGTNWATPLWQGRQVGQDITANWGFRDYVRANPLPGTPLASSNANPASLPLQWTNSSSNNAPIYLPNSRMLTISELGNIYDPAHINNTGTNTFTASQAGFRPSGGRTLRIGQPESSYWATNGGVRAMNLLDLFTVNTSSTSGRINVNTAPPEVLAAVFDGIQISSDAGVGAARVTNSLTNSVVAALIANRPYSRPGDLQKGLAGFVDGQSFAWTGTNVGNASTNTGNPFPAMSTMDRMREELFARSFNLLTTKSQVLRVYVIGQALGKNTNALATSLLETTVELRQDASGLWQPDIVMQK